MRRFFGVLAALLVLSACGSTGTQGITCKQQYWDGTIGLCLPAGWSIVPHETLSERGMPPEVITAFQRDQAVSGQTIVMVVTKETLGQDIDAKTYSDASVRSVAALPGYKLIDSRNQSVDGQAVQIHIYTAQPSAAEPLRRFYQLSTAAKGSGYTFTAISPLSLDTNTEKEIILMLSNVTLQAPSGSSSSK